ncbi:hypothetical protein SCLCIDRAFT_22305 [Scleroderma citrinum Foug A]|uniref:Uncharacterized protein n=1 Tax=Scleroderma citrinum Foug A TaxID=1036808 RepID=A0A0C3EDW6_9AGAM|nr:hypothetical protein SCLCIDRAFT_22305 [Scleroderma citrinum Foug A]
MRSRLLEALRASFTSTLALEPLQDFIYFTYTFYTSLLEEPTLCTFCSGWLEALSNLARYRMAVAAMVTNSQSSGASLTTDAISKAAATAASKEPTSKPAKSQVSSSDRPAACIDDSPTPSTGITAVCIMEIGPEMEWGEEFPKNGTLRRLEPASCITTWDCSAGKSKAKNFIQSTTL